MKNLKWILFIIVVFFSCDMTILDGSFWYLSKSYDIKSVDDVVMYVKDVNYKSDMSRYGKQYYQTPYETEVKKNGNCADKSILGLALAYKYLNIKGKLLLVDTNNNGEIDHAIYMINGKKYNKSNGSNVTIEIYNFDEIPYLASSKR